MPPSRGPLPFVLATLGLLAGAGATEGRSPTQTAGVARTPRVTGPRRPVDLGAGVDLVIGDQTFSSRYEL